jgi:hypothetical protein
VRSRSQFINKNIFRPILRRSLITVLITGLFTTPLQASTDKTCFDSIKTILVKDVSNWSEKLISEYDFLEALKSFEGFQNFSRSFLKQESQNQIFPSLGLYQLSNEEYLAISTYVDGVGFELLNMLLRNDQPRYKNNPYLDDLGIEKLSEINNVSVRKLVEKGYLHDEKILDAFGVSHLPGSLLDLTIKDLLDHLPRAFKKVPQYEGIVFRVENYASKMLKDQRVRELLSLEKGDFYSDKGLLSSSKNPHYFLDDYENREEYREAFHGADASESFLFVIRSNSGIDVTSISRNDFEEEVLFPSGQYFVVEGIERVYGHLTAIFLTETQISL